MIAKRLLPFFATAICNPLYCALPVSFLGPLAALCRTSPIDYDQRLFDAIERNDYTAAQKLVVTSCNDTSWKNGTIASVSCYNDTGYTPLIHATKKELPNMVRLLLAGGADPNQLGKTSTQSPLIIASQRGCAEIVEQLLTAGAKVNYQDENGDTALLLACYNNQITATRLLLDAKACVDHQATYGDTALLAASRRGHYDIVRMLIEAKAQLELQDGYAYTALCHASKKGHTNVVTALCSAHANINHQEQTGKTALILASIHGHKDIVQALIAKYANVNQLDQGGYGALMFAALYNHTTIARMLIKADADMNAHNSRDFSPLLAALTSGACDDPFAPLLPLDNPSSTCNNAIIRELLLRGAEPNEEEEQQLTAEQLTLVTTRRMAIHEWLHELEDTHSIPRDINRLIGNYAGLSSEHNLPCPTYTTHPLP